MPKRRRSVASGAGEEEPTLTPSLLTKRRKKCMVEDPTEICQELYDSIRNYKNDEGRVLCETFIRVPKRRTSAEYYDVISQPIDLMKIHHKLKNDEYEGVEEMGADLELMLNNAKMYYKRTTQEYSDATELWNHYQSARTEIMNKVFGEEEDKCQQEGSQEEEPETQDAESELETASTTTDTDRDEDVPYEELFAAVASARDGDREMALPFQLLPSRLAYEDYYKIITHPIDLKMIATKIKNNEYSSLEELEKDLILMVQNARKFNAPNSLIYKDAGALKKIVMSKKNELDAYMKPGRKSRRPKRGQPGQKLSEVYAGMQYPPDDQQERAPDAEDEDEDDNDDGRLPSDQENGLVEDRLINFEEDESGAESSVADGEETDLWALYKSLCAVKAHGQPLIEPFMKLPSRRFYPDYYDEIDRPISMLNIKKKLKRRQYDNMEELCEDLLLMFDNAQQYNTDESKIFKDAIKLQKVMRIERKKIESGVKNEIDEDDFSTPKRGPKGRRTTPTPSEKGRPVAKRAQNPEEILRKRLWMLFKVVHDFEFEGRPLIMIFMELPSKKDYPDYYQVISEPIDMSMIERKIVEDKYASDQELVSDFELMFNNARHYNEEHSQVYKDAETLEKVLKKKWRGMSPMPGFNAGRRQSLAGRQKTGPLTLLQKLTELHNAIKDYTDSRGRILSTPFMRLPPKTEYPNYYEIIKKPIDMQRIHQKAVASQYDSVDEMVQDFVLMFDNACRYNEPDSLIYKDSLTLQRVCLEKKAELCDHESQMPEVKEIVRGMMMNLFITTYNHQDEEGRCYSDSFVEFFHQTELKNTGQPAAEKQLTFDQIKRNINKGRYRRMDRFQQDMFTVFEEARQASRTDSQVFEDSVELQLFFIKSRDEICKNGEILLTPALSFTDKHLARDVEELRQEKLPLEAQEDEEKKRVQQDQDANSDKLDETSSEEGFTHNGVVYNVGDFVYLEPRDKTLEAHIVCVERLGKDESGEIQVHGLWMYRPAETYHLPTRKFLEKEVFRSDFSDNFPLAKVLGKCFVMSVKDYFKYKPEGFEDKDVYVCESRYSTKAKCFKKIKVWQMPKNETELVARPLVLPAIRVASVFAEKQNQDQDADSRDAELPEFIDKERETVPTDHVPPGADEGPQYYEQLAVEGCSYKLGDCVYVRSNSPKPFIARVDRLWTDDAGSAFFMGPWFMTPSDVEHSPTRLFYRKEVFRSNVESSTPLAAVMGKCVVLALRDYLMCRPLEYSEDDIYLCESKYTDSDRTIRKLPKGLKKFQLSRKVLDDEMYFFRKPLTPKKEPSPILMKMQLEASYRDYDENSNDTPSVAGTLDETGSQYNLGLEDFPETGTPQQGKKFPGMKKNGKAGSAMSSPMGTPKSGPKKRANPSGYILFSADFRKRLQDENQDLSFGEISKLVGTKWRNLPKAEKERYELLAKEKTDEMEREKAEQAYGQQSMPIGQPGMPQQPGFLRAGAPMPPGMYNQQYPHPPYPPQFQGPGMMMPGPPGAPMGPQGMGPPGMGPPAAPAMMMNYQGAPQNGYPPASSMAPPAVPARPPSPMFVTVPARTQRLVHSEAYIKYIESLGHEDRRRTPAWERDLSAQQNNTHILNPQKLPIQWLGPNASDNHQEAISALWNLREHLLKDALTITSYLDLRMDEL